MNLYCTGAPGAVRNKAGNLRCPYFFPMEEPDILLLIDSWKDQASLDAHHASPMMGTIAHLREKYGLHMRAERYTPEEPLPETDRGFLRK